MSARFLNIVVAVALPLCLLAGENLPQSVTFKGRGKFDALVERALKENWRVLP